MSLMSSAQDAQSRLRRTFGLEIVLFGIVLFNLLIWLPELKAVPYLNDSAVHEQMVRVATKLISSGHNPLASWFPLLNEGSPNFLHYQALPSILTGAFGTVVGADTAFRISLYLLLSLWPLCIYFSSRVWGLSRNVAVIAGICAVVVNSYLGIGYEQDAYTWVGWGVWTQLWGSWALAFAWAFAWRSGSSRRSTLVAGVFLALTICLHYETGYLAGVGVVVLTLLNGDRFTDRLKRLATIGIIGAVLSCWVTIPLLLQGKWASTNQVLVGSPDENGYGFKILAKWLFEGRLFDYQRLPVLTVLVLVGVVTALLHWKRATIERALLALFVVSFALACGRTTFGPLTKLVPASTDVFFRRFGFGCDLAGVMLAAIGAQSLYRLSLIGLKKLRGSRVGELQSVLVSPLAAALSVLIVLSPAIIQTYNSARFNNSLITEQRVLGDPQAAQLAPIISAIQADPVGRTYAGLLSNWGANFTVGQVPIFAYLEDQDIDAVGRTLRTASLMSVPEYNFDQSNAGDYSLFAIHYLILPSNMVPPVHATRTMVSGNYTLWVIPSNSYFTIGSAYGAISDNRTDIGAATYAYEISGLPTQHLFPVVDFGAHAITSTVNYNGSITAATGTMVYSSANLQDGTATAVVDMNSSGVLMLSASYDPGWRAYVNGHQVPVQMLAPALLGVEVSAGLHEIVFKYYGFPDYYLLFSFAALGLVLVLFEYRRVRTRTPVAASNE